MIKKVFSLCVLAIFSTLSFGQTTKSHWVDSVYQTLNSNQKVGQLFMIPVSSATDEQAIHEIENRIKSHEVGGLLFKNINPHYQVKLINHFQSLADVPLLIAYEPNVDAPDSLINLPKSILIGAVQNDTLIYQLGTALAEQLKAVGVNVLFGLNPLIERPGPVLQPNSKSFGQDKVNVTSKSLALMRGLQDNGVLACAPDFPIKNITVVDVQNGIPVLDVVEDSLQLFPYTTLINQGLAAISPGVSGFSFSVSESPGKKTSYSPTTLATVGAAKWIKKTMKHYGLALLDIRKVDLNNEKAKSGDAELFAFQNGNDLLMYPGDVDASIRKIKKAVKKNDLLALQMEGSIKKILQAKFAAGLWQKHELSADNIMQRVKSPMATLLKEQIHQNAVTVMQDTKSTLPIRILENRTFAYLDLGITNSNNEIFLSYLKKYANIVKYSLPADSTDQMVKRLREYTTIFVPIFPEATDESLARLHTILRIFATQEIILCDFGHPKAFVNTNSFSTVVAAYTDDDEAQKAVAELMFGAIPSKGQLPYSPSPRFAVGTGIMKPALQRLAYSIPEDAKMDGTILSQIDSIANEAIKIHATPGCQIWVARNGKVIYEKSFGHLTYEDQSQNVTSETIYDLASLTKVTSTLQAAMFMYERGLIDLNKKVSYYLPELKTTNKKDITILDMLTHQAGLVPFIPMYPQTIKDTTFLPLYYSRKRDSNYPLQVSTNLFASPVIRDSVWSWVLKSKMNDRPMRTPYSYKYSDLGFLILQRLAETLLNQPIDAFMQQNYYEPLGAFTMGYNPLDRFSKQRIAPTEEDKIYRKSFVSGTVHDERAAMLGGVAGHAGLFSTANDLGKLGQMLLQEGTYGGIEYYKPETVRLFTAKRFKPSRRGIGWDKPIQSDPASPTSLFASPKTYGHTGFTGTCMWVDPEFNLVYIFLSNRVYPDRSNKLSNANIRTRIQDVIYKSIFGYVEHQKPQYIVNDYAINSGTGRPLE